MDARGEPEEVERLNAAFRRMLERLDAERRRTSSTALAAQEEERARVARDLHDEVNQSLTALLLRLEAARVKAPVELAHELAETKALANQAMEELLMLARQLRPTALDDLGLKAALAGHVKELGRRGKVNASFDSSGDFSGLPADVQLVVYRVAQEALSNAAQHSGAEHVHVHLAREGDRVELTVADDGSGFTFDQAASGLGIAGMRERALLVGGDMQVESRLDSGTRVRLTVPLEPADSSPRVEAQRAYAEPVLQADPPAAMKVLIADDHGIVRSGLRMLLERQTDIEVIGEASDGAEARDMAIRDKPDLAILDVKMPKLTGLQATREIRAQAPDVSILILSMYDDERYLFEALKAGASGYVLKAQADSDLIDAVRAVERGEPFLTPEAQRALIQDVLGEGSASGGRADAARAGGREACRGGAHQPRDRGHPAPLREDGREPPLERDAKARHARPRRAGALRDPQGPDRAVTQRSARTGTRCASPRGGSTSPASTRTTSTPATWEGAVRSGRRAARTIAHAA